MDQQQQQQHSQAQHDPKHESQRPGHFDHHRLQAWRVALEALLAGRALCRTLPRGYGKLKDQLERALDGAFTLTSEAAARTGADRACRFRWARAEANEAAAILEALAQLGVAELPAVEHVISLLWRLSAMLTRLAIPRR
jgi:four helix bundle protein